MKNSTVFQQSDVIAIMPGESRSHVLLSPTDTSATAYIVVSRIRMRRSHSTAGWIWEDHVIQHLEKGTEELVLKLLEPGKEQLGELQIPLGRAVCYRHINSLATELAKFIVYHLRRGTYSFGDPGGPESW